MTQWCPQLCCLLACCDTAVVLLVWHAIKWHCDELKPGLSVWVLQACHLSVALIWHLAVTCLESILLFDSAHQVMRLCAPVTNTCSSVTLQVLWAVALTLGLASHHLHQVVVMQTTMRELFCFAMQFRYCSNDFNTVHLGSWPKVLTQMSVSWFTVSCQSNNTCTTSNTICSQCLMAVLLNSMQFVNDLHSHCRQIVINTFWHWCCFAIVSSSI